jgi:hypothetical protein
LSPLTETELVAIVEEAPAEGDQSSDNFSVADGAPAGEPAVAGITDLVRMSVACTNANDPMRSFALFTDRYLQERFGGDNEDDLGHLLAALTRTPEVAQERDRLTLDAIADVTQLPDGRVLATVTTSNSDAVFEDLLLFVELEGEWKIDAVTLGEPQVRSTPAA